MAVDGFMWWATLLGLLAIMILDLVVVDSRPHVFGVRQATRWVLFYIALAAGFAVFLGVHYGRDIATQFVAGYLTEYSLSVDNLFVFLVLMTSFAVPPALQHRVLLVGILIALVLRGALIAVGAAVLSRFAGAFFVFGAFLLWTAWQVWRSEDVEPDPQGNRFVRFVSRILPTTPDYHGSKLSVVIDGTRRLTPLFLVMLAIGTTDLLFALDSIPAIFGLTNEPYIVFTANAFALMGLRQLYFLLDGLLGRLVYLSNGLAVILGFIGVKLILEAMHSTFAPSTPTIGTLTSLAVIVSVLAITVVASLTRGGRAHDIERAEAAARKADPTIPDSDA